MNEHDLSFFHLRRGEVNIKLRKGMDLEEIMPLIKLQQGAPVSPVALPQAQMPAMPAPDDGERAASGSEAPEESVSDEMEITAPMVGTFYQAAAPEAPPFVKIGSEVDETTTVCIIEAMKVMNEIKPEGVRGVVTKVLATDASPVQFGQALYKVKPHA